MKKYNSEEEFLKDYDSGCYEKLSMTTDILIVSVSDQKQSNYRKTSKKMMSILLVKRDDYPFKGKWCLPGGFLNPKSETLEECAKRVLKDETNVSDIYLEQLYTFDGIDRDPRLRVISCGHVALIDKNKLSGNLAANASWFDVINYDEEQDVVTMELFNGVENIKFSVNKILVDKTVARYQYVILENDKLAFDNPIEIGRAHV